MRRIVPELKTIRRCTKKCRLYPCLYSDLSFSDQLNGKCALKQMPYRMQNRVVRLYLKGEQGVAEELVETLLRLAEMGELQDKGMLKQYYKHLIEYIKIVYGEKTRLSAVLKDDDEKKLTTREIVNIIHKANDEMEAEKQREKEAEDKNKGGFLG